MKIKKQSKKGAVVIERFNGEKGKRLLIDALTSQRIVNGNAELAAKLAECSELIEVKVGKSIIEQSDSTNEIFFIIAGTFSINVNGREITQRKSGEQVGEMGAIEPTQRRSATVTAIEPSVVAKVTEAEFDQLGKIYPELYKSIAQALSRRLLERNKLVRPTSSKVRVFIISSAESLEAARLIENGLSHDDFDVILWANGVFKVTNYTLQTLEDEVDQADFAIAVAHGDDVADIRNENWPIPRDNVIFELGLFMGRLGRSRAILMEPKGEKIKLPSDLAGVTTIRYKYEPGKDEQAKISPAVNEIRSHIKANGPR